MEEMKKDSGFQLSPLFDSRYYRFIVANPDLKEWFRMNQENLVSIGCINTRCAEEIMNNKNPLIPNQNNLEDDKIEELATMAESIFKQLDHLINTDLELYVKNSSFYSSVNDYISWSTDNIMRDIHRIHEDFENYKLHPEQRVIKKYDFNMIVDILKAVYDYIESYYGKVEDDGLWDGSISDYLTFKAESHRPHTSMAGDFYSKVSLKLEEDILTIFHFDLLNVTPTKPSDVKVHGATDDLVEKIYNEITLSKVNHSGTQERIENFKEKIEDYYKQMGKEDIVFDFLHVQVNYTYMSLNHPIKELLKEGEIQLKYEDRRQHERQTLFVPVVMKKNYYAQKFGDDLYHTKRDLKINEEIDIGDNNHFNYDGIHEKLRETIPSQCTIIGDEEMEKIANYYGYDQFGWEIYDKSVGLPPIAYGGPMWVYDFYGIKEKKENKMK